jgi:hypothetical protein
MTQAERALFGVRRFIAAFGRDKSAIKPHSEKSGRFCLDEPDV